MVIEKEANAYVFREGAGAKDTRINWAENRLSQPTMDSGSTAAWGSAVGTPDTLTSRGYREEQEHLAWLIREIKTPDGKHKPRCDGEVALADAVVALCSNLAMEKKKRIELKDEWFDPNLLDRVPEDEV
jgi:hypothetical protein